MLFGTLIIEPWVKWGGRRDIAGASCAHDDQAAGADWGRPAPPHRAGPCADGMDVSGAQGKVQARTGVRAPGHGDTHGPSPSKIYQGERTREPVLLPEFAKGVLVNFGVSWEPVVRLEQSVKELEVEFDLLHYDARGMASILMNRHGAKVAEHSQYRGLSSE